MEASWPDNTAEARKLQEELRRGLIIGSLLKPPAYIAGCDASYSGDKVIGAACLYKYPEIELVQEAVVEKRCGFPYVPGYLGFREGPALLEAIRRLKRRPDLLMFDGQGVAHPRGMGIASHLGCASGYPLRGMREVQACGKL